MADAIINTGGTNAPTDRRRLRDMGGGVFAEEVAAVAPPPAAGNVVGGAGDQGVTILTVPAGRTWRGSLSLAASASAAIGAAAANTGARLDIAGTGALPAAGTLLRVPLALPGTAATGTIGASGSASTDITDVVIMAGPDAPATVAVVAEAASVQASGTARGMLV